MFSVKNYVGYNGISVVIQKIIKRFSSSVLNHRLNGRLYQTRLNCHKLSLLLIANILYTSLLMQLSNRQQLIAEIVTASEAYKIKGRQYLLSCSTVTISSSSSFSLIINWQAQPVHNIGICRLWLRKYASKNAIKFDSDIDLINQTIWNTLTHPTQCPDIWSRLHKEDYHQLVQEVHPACCARSNCHCSILTTIKFYIMISGIQATGWRFGLVVTRWLRST